MYLFLEVIEWVLLATRSLEAYKPHNDATHSHNTVIVQPQYRTTRLYWFGTMFGSAAWFFPCATYTLHGTGTGNGTGKQMGNYILCRTVYITLEQVTAPDTIGFHTNFPVPGSVQCVWAITGGWWATTLHRVGLRRLMSLHYTTWRHDVFQPPSLLCRHTFVASKPESDRIRISHLILWFIWITDELKLRSGWVYHVVEALGSKKPRGFSCLNRESGS